MSAVAGNIPVINGVVKKNETQTIVCHYSTRNLTLLAAQWRTLSAGVTVFCPGVANCMRQTHLSTVYTFVVEVPLSCCEAPSQCPFRQ